MNDKFIEILSDTGFSEEHAKIYISLLSKKQLSITEISKHTQIKRPTCYEYIEEMLRKNYIYRVPAGKKFHYAATPPNKIVERIKSKVRKLDEGLIELNEIYSHSQQKPKVTFHEGKSGIREIYKNSFSAVGDALSIFPADEYFKQYSFEEFVENEKLIAETKFRSKDLIIEGRSFKKIDTFLKELSNDNKVVKKLPADFKTSVDVLVYGSKVALISLKNISAVVIDNQEIAELFTTIHSQLWKTGK